MEWVCTSLQLIFSCSTQFHDGRFAYVDAGATVATNYNQGSAKPAGFVARRQQGLQPTIKTSYGNTILAGYPV